MKFRFALAAATCLAMPLASHAQPVKGPYVSLGAGTSLQDAFSYNNHANGDYGKFHTTPSYSGAMSLGYGLGNGFRVEVGGNFYRNNINSNHDYGYGDISSAHGGTETYGPMVNVLYDFNAGLPIFPYLGAGAGYQWVHLSSHLNGNNGYAVGGDAGSFAYQLIAGASYPLPWVPGLSATAEYRFMQLVSSRNYSEIGDENGSVKLGQHEYHTFLLGMRYQLFNAPAAAPAPAPVAAPVAAPAPAPAKTYLVFFDWDKANLTSRATQIIAQAAVDSKSQSVTTLDVSGYTDTSGTPVYNQGLSERRAKVVAAQLVTDGVPASEIEIHAYGATHLLVPTGPGVREPQNRRVEIVLH
jgi:outer membrane protein OmpA-like peptidoglycan-associated protein